MRVLHVTSSMTIGSSSQRRSKHQAKVSGKFPGVRFAFNTGWFEASLSFLRSAEIVMTGWRLAWHRAMSESHIYTLRRWIATVPTRGLSTSKSEDFSIDQGTKFPIRNTTTFRLRKATCTDRARAERFSYCRLAIRPSLRRPLRRRTPLIAGNRNSAVIG